MPRIRLLATLTFIVIASLPVSVHASVPLVVSHQGRLLDAEDQPISGPQSITFNLYGSVGDTPLWTETHLLNIDDGLYHVSLGMTTPLDATVLEDAAWLGITVDPDPEMTPRLRLTSVPFAIAAATAEVAGNAMLLSGKGSEEFALASHTHDAAEIVTGLEDVVRAANTYYIKGNGTPAANGAAFLSALAAVSPSVTNPIVIKLEPGLYDIGTTHIETSGREYLTIEGSGPEATTLICSAGCRFNVTDHIALRSVGFRRQSSTALSVLFLQGTGMVVEDVRVEGDSGMGIEVFGGDASIVRSRIEMNGSNIGPGIAVLATVEVRDTDIQVVSTGSEAISTGITADGGELEVVGGSIRIDGIEARGIFLVSVPSATLLDVRIEASGPSADGIVHQGSGSLVMRNVGIDAVGAGLDVSAGTADVHSSTIRGTIGVDLGTTVRFGASQLDGAVSGSPICVASYDGSFAPLGADCQP